VPEGDGSHVPASPPSRRDGRWLRRGSAALVLVVLASAFAAFQLDLGPRWLGWDYPSPVTEPAEVQPPPGLTLPKAGSAGAVAPASEELAADPTAVRRALARLVREKKLGRRVAVDVAQLSDGAVVYRHGARIVTPASTLKILTTAAALEALGPDHRFTTAVVARPGAGRITLVGGGDPLLGRDASDPDGTYPARADLDTLARGTAQALRAAGRSRVRVGYDTSLFSGPAVNPQWEPSYIPDNVVSPISPLWVDEGRDRRGMGYRSPDPSAAAAQVFAQALRRKGIAVIGAPAPTVAGPSDEEIASVQSAPLAHVVQHVLEVSDNEGAEVLARHVAIAEGLPPSFVGGSRAVRSVLTRLGVDLTGARIYDGSGLSRHNRLRPGTLLAVIALAADDEHPALRSVVADLPVAGFTGSLAARFETGDEAGLGTVRAKTGTLSGVHGLAGTVTTSDGAVLGFVAVADRVRLPNTLAARALLDEMASALAGCTCASVEVAQ